jgi:hypothetical protein
MTASLPPAAAWGVGEVGEDVEGTQGGEVAHIHARGGDRGAAHAQQRRQGAHRRQAADENGAGAGVLARLAESDQERAEGDGSREAEAGAGGEPRVTWLARGEHRPEQREHDSADLERCDAFAAGDRDEDRQQRREGGERGDE